MTWPVRRLSLVDYNDWWVEVQDLSVEQVQSLNSALQEEGVMAAANLLLQNITQWNIADARGNVLPKTEEGMRRAPMKAVGAIIVEVLKDLRAGPLVAAVISSS